MAHDMNGKVISVGDHVYYVADGPNLVGEVTLIDDAKKSADVVYPNDSDTYTIDCDELIRVEKPASNPGSNPFKPDPDGQAAAAKPAPTPQAPDPQNDVMPGAVVTIDLAGLSFKRNSAINKFSKDRLWVVLAWTKNSNKSKVNILPLNGVGPGDPSYNVSYVTLPKSSCKRVIFKQPLLKVVGTD